VVLCLFGLFLRTLAADELILSKGVDVVLTSVGMTSKMGRICWEEEREGRRSEEKEKEETEKEEERVEEARV